MLKFNSLSLLTFKYQVQVVAMSLYLAVCLVMMMICGHLLSTILILMMTRKGVSMRLSLMRPSLLGKGCLRVTLLIDQPGRKGLKSIINTGLNQMNQVKWFLRPASIVYNANVAL
jgi:hypothetical protein